MPVPGDHPDHHLVGDGRCWWQADQVAMLMASQPNDHHIVDHRALALLGAGAGGAAGV
jgi:hypothetical protein